MNRFAALICTTAMTLALGACMGDELSIGGANQALDNAPDGVEDVRDFPRGTKVVMAPEYEEDLVESGAISDVLLNGQTTVVYMNRVGGVFTPGQNNAGSNRTTLAPQTVNFPAANLSDGEWAEVMGCVRQQFSRFDMEITDVDPGDVPHFESVVAGSPQLLGMPNGVGGVSPFTSNCDIIPNSIVFTFTDVLPRDPQIICEVAAQEIAHSFGLDHEYLCSDPMTYLSGCGAKSFQDVYAPCGEDQARSCAQPGQYDCGYAEQNSVQLLAERVGLNDGSVPGNEVAIMSPADGATVNYGFEVSANVDYADRVEFRIDGNVIASISSPPYLFSTPDDLTEGTHVLEIVAITASGEDSDSISVNLVEQQGPGGDGSPAGGAPGEPAHIVGGCQSGGSSSGVAAGLLALALVVIRRRRVLDTASAKKSS